MTERVRYRVLATGQAADYVVETQAARGQRWVRRGMVSRFGAGTWGALGDGADAWTRYRRTRGEAVADMLAGLTFRAYEQLAGAR